MKRLVIVCVLGAMMGLSSTCWGQSATKSFQQGEAYLRQRNLSGAVEAFKQALEIDPAMEQAYMQLGLTYRLQNDYENAIQAYLKAVELAPDNAEAYLGLGALYQLTKEDELAEQSFETYRKLTGQ